MEEWLLLQGGLLRYVGLFLLLMGGAFGLPIPEDLPLILAGIMAHNGNGKIEILFAVCYSAIILGDLIIYGFGRKLGPTIHKSGWFSNRISQEKLLSIKRSLEKRGILMIFVARHLFYFRTVTFLACGAFGMDFKKFVIADTIAALVSVPLMMWLGYTGADQFDAMVTSSRKNDVLTLIFGILVVCGLIYFFVKRKSNFEVEGENGPSN